MKTLESRVLRAAFLLLLGVAVLAAFSVSAKHDTSAISGSFPLADASLGGSAVLDSDAMTSTLSYYIDIEKRDFAACMVESSDGSMLLAYNGAMLWRYTPETGRVKRLGIERLLEKEHALKGRALFCMAFAELIYYQATGKINHNAKPDLEFTVSGGGQVSLTANTGQRLISILGVGDLKHFVFERYLVQVQKSPEIEVSIPHASVEIEKCPDLSRFRTSTSCGHRPKPHKECEA